MCVCSRGWSSTLIHSDRLLMESLCARIRDRRSQFLIQKVRVFSLSLSAALSISPSLSPSPLCVSLFLSISLSLLSQLSLAKLCLLTVFYFTLLLSGQKLCSIVCAEDEDILSCASSSTAGFKVWKELSDNHRAKFLLRYRHKVQTLYS